MRKILFRAIAAVDDESNNIKSGDMIFGQFIESGVDAPCIVFGDGEQIKIQRDTLGQLTGMNDRNGNPIFEGDALRQHHDDGESNYFGIVEWAMFDDWFGWSVKNCDYNDNLFVWESENIEVIGNVHENSALRQ